MAESKQLIAQLRSAGLLVVAPRSRHFSLVEAAEQIGVSATWVRDHLGEFPGAWRLPAGAQATSTGARNVGELRIPAGDIEALAQRMRLERAA